MAPLTPSVASAKASSTGSRYYGHRVLIASLFLPDTINFHEFDSSIIDSPRGQSAVPPSPPSADQQHYFPIDELGTRLAGVSAAFREQEKDAESSPVSRGDAKNDVTETSAVVADFGPLPPRRESPAMPSQTSRHSSYPQKLSSSQLNSGTDTASRSQVNMTKLMAEAARRPSNNQQASSFDGLGTAVAQKRQDSGQGQSRPSAAPTPSSSVADHGRGVGDSGKGSAVGGPSGHSSTFGNRPTLARGVTSHSIGSQGLSSERRRRGSSSTAAEDNKDGTAPMAKGSNFLSIPGQNASSPNRKASDSTSSRTPGATGVGKAGPTQPLSIIGDLQARQTASIVPPASTPGDAERHHPFGGGAATPFRGTQTPGNAPRGAGLSQGVQTPSTHNKGFHSGLTPAPRSIPGLTMTKSSGETPYVVTGSAAARHVRSSLPSTCGSPMLPQSSSPSAGPNGTGADASGLMPRPALQQRLNPNPASAVASVSFNDHGRGGQSNEDSRLKGKVGPSPTSERQTHSSPSHKHLSHALGSDKGSGDSGTASPTEGHCAHSMRHGRFSSGAGCYNKLTSPWLPRSGSRRRRAVSTLSRKSRRSSHELLAKFDEADDDGGNFEHPAYEELPPHGFISNPASNGGLVNAVACLSEQRKVRGGGRLYIGTPGFHADEAWLRPHHRRALQQEFRDQRSSIPVWVEEQSFRGAYHRFCKGILWPTFHYTLPTDRALEAEHESFECYKEVNLLFAKRIAKEWNEGDIVLINDYHLLLVPQLLRELIPSANIGLFVHIAFPSSELFRCLAMRETLLRGMLGADLVGFQTHNFCRHFRQTVSRTLQLEATAKGVQTETSFTTVSPFPIGIDPQNLNAKRSDPEVAEWVAKLTERYEGKKVIVGRDKLDWIRGVRQKLLAFEIFLKDHPEWVGKVVLIQVALATNEENNEAGEASDVVSRINSRYASLTYQPVVFLHVQDITFSQYLALLTVADAFMANSLREGMNLTTHEYIICQEEKQSPLILSEFTGTWSALRACISINPWCSKQVAHAIHKALVMPKDEQEARWADLHRTVVTQTALQWITSLLSRLERAHIDQQRRDNAFIPKLEVGQLVAEWRASKTRLILLDLEGSLLPESILLLRKPEDLVFSDTLLSTLRELSEDPRNSTYVMSALSTEFLDRLAEQLPGLGIVAEDGCAVKHPGRAEWISLIAGLNSAWKGSVIEILKYFQDRTPGSFLHDRGATLFFSTGQVENGEGSADHNCDRSHYHPTHDSASDPIAASRYRSQESQWARRQLAEINNLVFDSLGERFSLRIIPRGTTLTISPKNVSRASAAQHIVQLQAMGVLSHPPVKQDTAQTCTPDLGIAAGDQSTLSSVQNQSRQREWLGNEGRAGTNARSSPQGDTTAAAVAFSPPTETAHSLSQATSRQHQSFFHSLGPTGNFDFAVYIGSDERLIAYVASLDLPFAPLTVTTANIDLRGSEAGFCLPVGRLGAKCLKKEDVEVRKNDTPDGQRGKRGEGEMEEDGGVLEALKELVAFRRRDMRWGRSGSEI